MTASHPVPTDLEGEAIQDASIPESHFPYLLRGLHGKTATGECVFGPNVEGLEHTAESGGRLLIGMGKGCGQAADRQKD